MSDDDGDDEADWARAQYELNRRLAYLEEYKTTVDHIEDRAIAAEGVSVDYAQLSIRSGIIINGGALLAIPAFRALFENTSETSTDPLITAAIWFVAGLASNIACAIACHINFRYLSVVYLHYRAQSVSNLQHAYGLVQDDGSLEEKQIKTETQLTGNNRKVSLSFWVSWLLGTGAMVGFVGGATTLLTGLN